MKYKIHDIHRCLILDWMLATLWTHVVLRLYEVHYPDLCRQKPIASSAVLRSRVFLLIDPVFLESPVIWSPIKS